MRGSVIKRGTRWCVVVDLGRDPVTGKRIRNWHSGFESKKAAERARTEILNRLDKGTYVEPSRRTLTRFLVDEWLPATKGRLADSTFDSYRRNIELHIVPRLGNIELQALTPARLNTFYGELLASGSNRSSDGGLAPKTVRNLHVILRKALHDAVRWSLIPRNPAEMADPPRMRGSASRIKTWNADEARAFLAHVQSDEHFTAWLLALTTGMRRGEILGLRWDDVDFERAQLSIRQTLVNVAYEVKLSSPKTLRSRRSLALDPATLKALREHRERTHHLERSDETFGHLVFIRDDGQWIHPDRFTQLFDKHVRQAKLKRIRFHDVRHTYATLALTAGVHPKIVSERLGHATVAFTLDVYSHVVPGMQQDAAALVAGLIVDTTDD
jgi:integrase